MNTSSTQLILRCIGCLCEENNVTTIKLQSELLRVVFQEDSLKLCYICKKLAQNTELFVRTVHNNQILLHSLLNIPNTDININPQPFIQLQTKVLELDCQETQENTPQAISKCDFTVKLEKSNGQDDEILYNEMQDSYDDIPESDLPLIKQEDVLVEDIKIEPYYVSNDINKRQKHILKKKTTKKKGKKLSLTEKTDKMDETSIIILNLTKKEFMQEREELAKKNLYLSAKYKCKDCVKGFIYKEIYDKHMELHLKSNGEYLCTICKQRMGSAEKLERHKRKHLIRYKCQECGLIRNNHSTIKDHYTSVHKKQGTLYSCPECSKVFINSGALRRHKHYRHKKNRITCDICLKSYVTKYYLRKHIELQHSTDNSFSKWAESRCKYKCEECGKAFPAPSQLRNHMGKHSDIKNYFCVECNKTFKTEISLNEHLKRLPHVDYSELPLQCDQCEKRFRVKRDLAKHMNRIHLGTRPYQCDKCEKGYADQWSLTEHIRYKHEGFIKPRKYPCTFCDKVFKTNSTCKIHIRTHTGERPYKCTECPAAFSQSGILNTHVKLVHLKLTRDGRPKPTSIERPRYDYN